MIKILGELSQILAAIGIFASQEEQILIVVKNLCISPKVIEEPKVHEPHLQEEPKASTVHFFQSMEEIKDSWTIYARKQLLEHEIKKAKEENR